MSKLSIIEIMEKLDTLNKSNPPRYMTNGSKNKKLILPHSDPMTWVLSNGVEDTPFQKILFSNCLTFPCMFDSILQAQFGLISCIIALKEFVSKINKQTRKRHFLAFPGNGCKKGKNILSITIIMKIQTNTKKTDMTG